ncbi:MAG: hypothetical protein AB4062_10775 [Crocosphaera sp.]
MEFKLKPVKTKNYFFQLITNFIKVLSTILISSAILWELGNIYARVNGWDFNHQLNWIFLLDRLALISHGVEAIIAAYYAKLQNQNPYYYSIYTFFVGTLGLLELKREQQGQE